jgi:hypothetical protein
MAAALLNAIPSARTRWDQHLEYWGDDERGDYLDMAEFAHHIVECYRNGETDELPSVFALIERFVTEGPSDVRGLATVGLLETIQTVGSHDPWGYEVYEQWLGPHSRDAWQATEKLWAGKSSLMDVVRSLRRE